MYALVLTLLFIAIGWVVILRPQQQRLRDQREMQAALAVGDEVVSAGGIFGTLAQVDDETVVLTVAPGVDVTVARPAIVRRLDPNEGSPKDGPMPTPDLPNDGSES